MEGSNCLNCQRLLAPDEKYCPACGQSSTVHRFTMANFFHEGFHAFTHTDKGIFHLLKCLATKPGTTAREYITGKRKSYFSPFTFFLILMGIFVLSNNFFKKAKPERQPDAQVLKHIPTEEGRQKYIGIIARSNSTGKLFTKHGNVVAMVAVPFISLFTWLFFRRRGFNYAEHLTANMMFVAFSNLVFTVVIFPLSTLMSAAGSFAIIMIGLLLQAVYFGWALNGFLQLKTAGQRTKSLLVSVLAIILWSIFSMLMTALYIYQSGDFYQFFSRMKG
ncbi:MAG: DUF3667 domain-containing protein [Chitinophagaceae bacterium]|nr:MAG: DUF3667 domain-containing protein [Chitinophagaceae bacterium]